MIESKHGGSREGSGRKPMGVVVKSFTIDPENWQKLDRLPWGEKSRLINALLKKYFNGSKKRDGNPDV